MKAKKQAQAADLHVQVPAVASNRVLLLSLSYYFVGCPAHFPISQSRSRSLFILFFFFLLCCKLKSRFFCPFFNLLCPSKL